MKKLQVVLLMLVVLICVMVTSPTHAQTTDEILADANNEAVLVISDGLARVLAVLGGMLITVIAIYAYALYRSSPKIIQELIVKNGQDTLKAFSDYAEKTTNKIDDKIANAATSIFGVVMELIKADELKDTPPTDKNTSSDDKTPLQ